MEQRTRILHHTRSKTPIILAPKHVKPRVPASNSLSSLSKNRREKAPLASMDREFSSSPRRHGRSRDFNGARSSSTGRHEMGSRRIISREALISDSASDRSIEDDDRETSPRSVPLRRHTMGSTARPLRKSCDSPDDQPTPSSRISSPPSISASSTSHQPTWHNPQQSLPNGPTLKYPTANAIVTHDPRPTSSSLYQDHIPCNNSNPSVSSSNSVSPCTEFSSQIVISPNSSTHSDFFNYRTIHTSNALSQQAPSTQFERNAVPTTLSSQLAQRNIVNHTSPGTSNELTFAVSSHRQSIPHPPSSLNISTSKHSLSPQVSSPTTSFHSKDRSPQTSTTFSYAPGYSWRTDPRRRPVRSSAEFNFGSRDEQRDINSPTSCHAQTPTNTDVSQSSHTNKFHSLPYPSSSQSKTCYTRQYVDADIEIHKVRDTNASLSPQFAQQQCYSGSYDGSVNNNKYNEHPHGTSAFVYGNDNQHIISSPDHRTIDTKDVVPSSLQDRRLQSTSSSSKCLDSDNHPRWDHVSASHTQTDIHSQGTQNLSPLSPKYKESTERHIDLNTRTNNAGYAFISDSNTPHSMGKRHAQSTRNGKRSQVYSNSIRQISEVSLSPKSSNGNTGPGQHKDYLDAYIGYRFCRKRDSMRMATEDYVDTIELSQSIKCIELEDTKYTLERSVTSSRSRVAGTKNSVDSNTLQNKGKPDSTKTSQDQVRLGDVNEKQPEVGDVQCDGKVNEPLSAQATDEPFVRRSIMRDSYRLATSSNPDLTLFGQGEDIFVSCEEMLSPKKQNSLKNNQNHMSDNESTKSWSRPTNSNPIVTPKDQSDTNSIYSSNSFGSFNAETLSRIKRNSFRLATASLSDLSIILDEIDIGEPTQTPFANDDLIEHPSPLLSHIAPKLSPLLERSLGRSGSSVSSRNGSSFGSFYSCQSMGHLSARNSPNHTSSQSSPRDSKPTIRTPDSVHRLILNANAHDSGISQSSEDTNSYFTPANTSIGSGEDMDFGVNHLPQGGSLNRRKPVFYWTRQSPYPRPAHNTIPASWKPKDIKPSRSVICKSSRSSGSGSIRSYGSSSSVESGSVKTKSAKNIPATGHFLQRYGCGLDSKNPMLCGKGSNESLPQKAMLDYNQTSHRNGTHPGNRRNLKLPLQLNNQNPAGKIEINFDSYTQRSVSDSPTIPESPNADTPRSPPSLGRPRRKLYAGFDSQPLPIDSFMSDSSSVYTEGVSCSSRGTEMSGQPDSGTFDESFYSIDNRSAYEESDCSFEASLTPKEFVNLGDIRKNTQLQEFRSDSLQSTSTTKGDAEDSYEQESDMENTIKSFQHNSSHQVWSNQNYNQTVAPSVLSFYI